MSEFMKRGFLLISFLCLCTAGIFAQVKITGRVIDDKKQTVDAAIIMLLSDGDKKLVEHGITNANGVFSFNPPMGNYILYVRCLGYDDIQQNIQITGRVTIPDIILPSGAVSLDEVTITARQRRSLAKMTNGKIQINVAESYLTNLGNALDVLRHSPGISVSSNGTIALSALGGTAVYVNGKKVMLQGEALTSYLRSLPSTKIERIETSPNPDARYETDGSGGIVNIVLRSNDSSGFFVATSHGLSYWENLRESSDLSMSYNTEKWQVGVNYNHAIGHYAMKYGSNRIQDGNRNLSSTDDTDKRNTYAGGVNIVWSPTDKHKVSINTSVDLLGGPGNTYTRTEIYDGLNTLQKVLSAENDYIKQRNLRYGGNISYQYMPSDKQSLSLTADWIKFDGLSKNNQPNSYFTPDNTLLNRDVFYSETRKDIDIYSLMLDYKYVPNSNNEFLVGAKSSIITSDNNFQFESNDVFDSNRSNRFDYKEKNVEGYGQYTRNWEKWSLSGGVRLEYMHTDGKLQPYNNGATDETNKSSRFRVFPNLSLSYGISEQTKISANYSMRQDKPRYEDLNPFEFLLDELTYWKGNPFLKPQINNKFALNLSMHHLGISLSYSRLSNYFTSLTDVYGQGKIVMTTKNIGKQQQVGFEMMYSRRVTPWWDMTANGGVYYFLNQLDYETYREDYKRPSGMLSLTNDIALPWKIRFELSGRFYSKRQGGSYDVAKSSGSIDTGLNRSFIKDRLHLSLIMTDILHSERWDSYGTKGDLNINSWGYGESRQIIFRLRYNFGKQKFKANKQSIDELNRL